MKSKAVIGFKFSSKEYLVDESVKSYTKEPLKNL